jgi:hypothetical protein
MEGTEQQRVGRNEALFRQTNEAIERGLWPGEERKIVRFRCECAQLDCQNAVELTLEEYEAVRANPVRFVVLPGHELPEVERVVERQPGYLVVEKQGEAATRAAETDPRRQT